MITGEQLAKRRKALGNHATQAWLGEQFGAAGNTVARWEREEPACPYPGMLALAMDALESRSAAAVEPLVKELTAKIENLQQIRNRLKARKS
jgi:hypothetical protein